MNRKELIEKAKHFGLYIATWSPGDGKTRYRFFTENISYFQGDGIYTALGVKEAVVFFEGFKRGLEV